MNALHSQVRAARRRLTVQQFLRIVPWTTSGCLLVAIAAIVAPKLWPLAVLNPVWSVAWITGAVVLGMLVALGVTWWYRQPALAAAMEIDRRCGLRERVSSCLSLTPDELASEVGTALVQDATCRIAHVDVRQAFHVRPNRWALMPVVTTVVAFGLTLLSDAQPNKTNPAQAAAVSAQKRVQNSTEELRKRLDEQRKQAVAMGLEDAGDTIKKLEQGLENLAKRESLDQQKTLVKLNDLARDVQERQQQLGGREEIRKQMESLKDIKQGPADRMAKAMKQGDFKMALSELQELQKKLEGDEMTAAEKEQLQQQLEEMKKKLEEAADAQARAKEELAREIDKKAQQGDREGASKLQKRLDEMTKQDQTAKRSKEMAEKLGNCAKALQQGKSKEAAAQLGDMAADLDQMAQEMDEMELLEDAMDQIAQAKDAMNCSQCNGMGCSRCQGSMMGQGKGDKRGGKGMGEGRGEGDRPESETDTNFYDSQVRDKMGKGRAVVTGPAQGPNRAGDALEEIKAVIESGQKSDEDPLTGQRLPKPQRQLTREYFDAFREGK